MARQRLRLRDFDYSAPGAYFITVCTHRRRPRLVRDLSGAVEHELLVALPARFSGLVIDYHVVMEDHVHAILLLDGSSASLIRIVQAFKSLTTGAVPPEGRPLWQRGYYEHVIRDDDELTLIREYIRDNPIAAAIRFGR